MRDIYYLITGRKNAQTSVPVAESLYLQHALISALLLHTNLLVGCRCFGLGVGSVGDKQRHEQ